MLAFGTLFLKVGSKSWLPVANVSCGIDERRETRKEAHTQLLCEVLIQAFRVPGTGCLQGGKQIVSALICQKLYQICIWIVTLDLHCGILCLSTSILSSDIENLKNRTFTAERSGDLKNKCQDISKLKPNKTDNNKPEYKDTDDNDPESLNKAEKENFIELNSS